MLKKVVLIKNVGTFRNCARSGDTEMRKLNLVHAENGRGKTTLCAILRSLQSGDPTPILERKTLDSTDAPSIQILTDTGLIHFKNGAWESTFQKLAIFDAEFVASNVYSGDAITHDHKKNLCRVVLGAEGVKLAKVYDDLDAEERTAGTALNAAKAAAQKLVPVGMTLDGYIELQPDPQIDQKITDKKAEIAIAANAGSIKEKAALSTIKLQELPTNSAEILGKTLEGISSDAAQSVAAHLSTHKTSEKWLGEGVTFAKGANCPLCDQTLSTSPIFDKLKSFFSDAYRRFQTELTSFKANVERPLNDAALMAIQKTITTNAALGEYWKQYCRLPVPTISFEEHVQPVIINLRTQLGSLVASKIAAPLTAIELSPAALTALQAWTQLKTTIDEYNKQVAVFDGSIIQLQSSVSHSDTASLQKQLSSLEAIKKRQDQEVVQILLLYIAAKTKKIEVEIAKEKAKKDLDEYNVQIIGSYQVRANYWLGRFSAGFKLNKVKIEYTGRTPRAAYVFEIRGMEVDPGDDAVGNPSFRNTLSSGDRNTLALAFFVAQLETRTDLAELSVVFDDPFTSLDAYRQQWTCHAIRKLAQDAKQVIVLSHSIEFLKMVANRCDSSTTKTLKIDRQNSIDSHIVYLDLDNPTAVVDADLIKLRSFYFGDDKDAHGTVRCIRPLIENYIRTMAPDDCPPGNGWLGNFLGLIKRADSSSPLAQFQTDYDDLDFLNTYTSPYHHDSGMSEAINEGELTQASGLTLKVIGRL